MRVARTAFAAVQPREPRHSWPVATHSVAAAVALVTAFTFALVAYRGLLFFTTYYTL